MYRLKLIQDSDCMNPREWDNLGTFVGWHRDYNIGDEQPSCDPSEYLADLPDDEVILNVYAYEHGGIVYSTDPFACAWDSGQVGFIHCSSSHQFAAGMDRDAIEACLRSEVEIFSQWASGDVYGYVVEKWEPADCGDPDHGEWVETDSCWGFYGTDWQANGIYDALPDEVQPMVEDTAVTYC